MNNKLYILILMVCVTSCELYPSLTQIEQDAINKILSIYGGQCNITKSTTKQDSNYYELRITNSSLVNEQKIAEFPASHVAYLFYTSLGQEESNFSEIEVSLQRKNSEVYTSLFFKAELQEIKDEIYPVMDTLITFIKEKQYDKFINHTDTRLSTTLKELQSLCLKVDTSYGEIKEVIFIGFEYATIKDTQQNIVRLSTITVREKGNIPLTLYIDRKTKKVSGMHYNYPM